MSYPRKNAIRPLIEAPPVQDDSADYICAVVSVPNTESYKAILVGVLEVAAKWINYMPSGTDREAVVAAIWGEIIDNMVFDICQCVADCIANDAATQTAIANAIASNQSIQNSIQQASQNAPNNGAGYYNSVVNYLADNQIPNDALCTDANKYAMALATVRALDKMTTDMLEIIEFLTDANEIAAELIGAIPLFGGAASSALDTANWLQDHIQTAYNAAYNATTERDYACSIYCNFQDCDLSYEDIIIAYEEQGVIEPPTDTDWFTVLTWLITNIVPASQNTVVGAMHYLILIMLEYGSTWFGSGVWSYIKMEIENAKDEEITVPAECSCSTTWCWEWNGGTEISADWVAEYPSGGGATFSARGSEFIPGLVISSGVRTAQSIELTLPTGTEITEIETDNVWDVGMNGTLTYPLSINRTQPSSAVIERWTKTQLGSPTVYPITITRTFTGLATVDAFRIFSGSDVGNEPTLTGALLRIRLSGNGTLPTFNGGSAC